MVDFDSLVNATVEATFGTSAIYTPAGGAPLPAIQVTFFNGYLSIDDGLPPPPQSARPHIGVQLVQFGPGFDVDQAQGDGVVVNGIAYVVKSAQPDGTGWANFELQLAP